VKCPHCNHEFEPPPVKITVQDVKDAKAVAEYVVRHYGKPK